MENIYAFDMGKVILKSSNLNWLYQKAKPACSYQTFKKLFYDSDTSTAVYSGLIDDDTFFKKIKEKADCQKSASELKELYLQSKGEIYDSTLQIINYLKKYKNMICLLSNLKEIDYFYLNSIINMKIFDKTFLSYTMGLAKPDKRIYEAVINELETKNFYFFDDNEINVKNAKELGINAHVVTGDNIDKCMTKILVKNLSNKILLTKKGK